MADPKNLGIAVTQAKRLNDCYFQLSALLEKLPSIEGDEALWYNRPSIHPGSEQGREWAHRLNSRNVAESLIRSALSAGSLPVWVRRNDGECQVDKYALKELGHRTIRAGAYLPFNDHDSDLRDRPLWIKCSDWRSFLAQVLQSRYSEDQLVDIMRVPLTSEASGSCSSAVTSTAKVESECRDWLLSEFAADPDRQRTKADFKSAALARFSGRLSQRGFIRAWDAVAGQAGRSKPGRKS